MMNGDEGGQLSDLIGGDTVLMRGDIRLIGGIPPQSPPTRENPGHPKKPSCCHYDITSQYLVFKIAHFVELNGSYQPAKLHWPRLSGSHFTRGGGTPPPPPPNLHALKSPVIIGL